MLSAEEADNLISVPNVVERGARMGHWLSREQAKELLAVPDRSTIKGQRLVSLIRWRSSVRAIWHFGALLRPETQTALGDNTATNLAKLLLYRRLDRSGFPPSPLAVCQIISTKVGHLISKTTEMGLARTIAKSLPGIGQLANGLAFGADAATAYKDYKACMAR
jgi:hypothetical protein